MADDDEHDHDHDHHGQGAGTSRGHSHSHVSGFIRWPDPQNTHRSVGRPGRLGQI